MKNTLSRHSGPDSARLTPPFYFFSDTHISPRPGGLREERTREVLQLLRNIGKSGGTLFILGDFFDFWFDCRNYIPPALRETVETLAFVREQGVEIHYVGGNHDYWVRGYLTRELGIRFYPEAISFTWEGCRFWCQHGDEVVYNHFIYPYIRKLLRAPWAIGMLKLLPAGWIYALGEGVSHYNRAIGRIPRVPEEIVKKMCAFLKKKTDAGYDVAVSGHVHKPCLEIQDGKYAAVLGDWIHHRSYGIWDPSGFRLIRGNGDEVRT